MFLWDVLIQQIYQIEKGGHFFQTHPARRRKPSKHSKREIVNGILYVLRAGCASRLLPHDLPPCDLCGCGYPIKKRRSAPGRAELHWTRQWQSFCFFIHLTIAHLNTFISNRFRSPGIIYFQTLFVICSTNVRRILFCFVKRTSLSLERLTVDSTALISCHVKRASSHRRFRNSVRWSKTTTVVVFLSQKSCLLPVFWILLPPTNKVWFWELLWGQREESEV